MPVYAKSLLSGALLAFGLALAGGAQAALISSLLGDKDCFGLGGTCPDGTLWRDELGGDFSTSNQGGGDPAFSDIWGSPGSVAFSHAYALGGQTPLSAVLEMRIAGIHDINTTTDYDVDVDGVIVGQIPPNFSANNFQEVLTYLFAVPVGLIDGTNNVSFGSLGGDGFSIDFSELRISTQSATQSVPEPSMLALLGLALAGLGFSRRRKLH